jgi:hypothetical protein
MTSPASGARSAPILPDYVPIPRATVDPTPYFQKYGENLWAAVKGFLEAVADAVAAPVIEKYTGVLGAVDVFTVPTAFSILESIRLDLGYRMDVHPVSKP